MRELAAHHICAIESWAVLGEALQQTGMTADEAALVLGGNMMRVAGQVWG